MNGVTKGVRKESPWTPVSDTTDLQSLSSYYIKVLLTCGTDSTISITFGFSGSTESISPTHTLVDYFLQDRFETKCPPGDSDTWEGP